MNKSNLCVKSNVSLKKNGVIPPVDNLPNEYYDVRFHNSLSFFQRVQKEKILFWSNLIFDENNIEIKDDCFKGCINCGEEHNYCKLKTNMEIQKIRQRKNR